MYLTRRNQNWLPEVFNTLFDTDMFPAKVNTTSPAINVIERENEYSVEIAAPGMTREDFKVTLDQEQNLVVDLEKKVENPAETEEVKDTKPSGRYLRREFSYTKFHQTLLLPEDVDREGISASCEHGVLTVTLPKLTPEQKTQEARVIEVK